MKKRTIFFNCTVCFALLMLYSYSGIQFFRSYEKEFLIENQEAWSQQFSLNRELVFNMSVKLKGEVEGDLELIFSKGENEWKIDVPQQEVNRYTGTSFIYDWYSKDVTVTIKSKKGKI